MISESELLYHLLCILTAYCLLYPPKEFIDIGLTIDQIWTKFVGHTTEEVQFIQYHLDRTVRTAIIHSLLPVFYVVGYEYNFAREGSALTSFMWKCVVIGAVVLALFVLITTVRWIWPTNVRHPLVADLRKYSNSGNNYWEEVATSINDEFRRLDKIISKVNSITTVIVTENWVMKTTPYHVQIAHQSDTALIAVKSDTHSISQDATADMVQYVNINVKPTRTGVREFTIRVNALDFKELQDRVHRPITILSGVTFNQSVIERFTATFKELIRLNPRYKSNQVLVESCFACMLAEPNIKLQKCCVDTDGAGNLLPESARCGTCFCRPMWCVDCMAKWFASRQHDHSKDVWLQQKCTCPMCRAQFCMLDVCYVERDA